MAERIRDPPKPLIRHPYRRVADRKRLAIGGFRKGSKSMIENKLAATNLAAAQDKLVSTNLGQGGGCQSPLTFSVELPWPPRALSPNARGHWAATAKVKKAYRAKCAHLGRQAGLQLAAGTSAGVRVHLSFFPPDRRGRDWDNLLASMKAGLDGLADAMGVDDRHWRLSFDVSDDTTPGGQVLAEVVVA